VLFGPSAAGGAYIPAFCDVVIMREGNASMYLGSPRMAEMVIGEKVSLEEDGGRAHAHRRLGLRSPAGGKRRGGDRGRPQRYLSYLPSNWAQDPPPASRRRTRAPAMAAASLT